MGFIPKLDDISLGEYIDIETNISDWQKMHKAMAVLYRPVNFKLGNKYGIAPYEVKEEVQERNERNANECSNKFNGFFTV